jgi:hypothetical protein
MFYASGEPFKICLQVRNKLLSSERITISVDVDDNMLITGTISSAVEVLPHYLKTVEFNLIPLIGGQVRFPRIKLMWDRYSLSILDFNRSVFVKPT